MSAFKIDVFTFNEGQKLIEVDPGVNDITVQQIYNASRIFESEPANLDIFPLVTAGGKDDLGNSRQVGITLTMINNWRVKFADEPGPTVIIKTVTGGNFLATNIFNDSPVAASTFTAIVIAQDTSPSIVESGISGLTATESTQLAKIEQVPSDVWEEPATGHIGAGTTGLTLNQVKADTTQISLDTIDIQNMANLLMNFQSNRMLIDTTNHTMTVYQDDGTTVMHVFDLYDASGNPSSTDIVERVPRP